MLPHVFAEFKSTDHKTVGNMIQQPQVHHENTPAHKETLVEPLGTNRHNTYHENNSQHQALTRHSEQLSKLELETRLNTPMMEQNLGPNKVDEPPGRVEGLSQNQARTQHGDDSTTNEEGTHEVRLRAYVEVQGQDASLEATGRTSKSFAIPGHNSTAWPTELEKTCPDWTEAFKGMPLRSTAGQPSRLVCVQSGEVVCPKKPVQYAAVSYAWGQWNDMKAMLCRLRSVMGPIGLVYAWIDHKCIIQDSDADKRAEIKRMREYYAQAAITYVMVPEWSTTFSWEISGFVMSKEQAVRAAAEIRALKETEWASRVWTMQEALLSGRTVFVGRSEVKSAVELAVARSLKFLSGDANGHVHASWRRKAEARTVVIAKEPTFQCPALPNHILRDSVILTATDYAKTSYSYIDDVWRITGQRRCSLEEDRVYGMLGLLRGGDAMSLEYGIGFEEAVRRAADMGLVSSGILLAETSSQQTGRCWCPRSGTESRYMPTKRRKWDGTTELQSIQLTPEGLCKVQGARFRMMRRPDRFEESGHRFFCKNREGGRDFGLKLDNGVPEGEDWRGDWLAVVEVKEGRWPIRAILVKYETQDESRLHKLRALEADIWFLENEYVREFLLG